MGSRRAARNTMVRATSSEPSMRSRRLEKHDAKAARWWKKHAPHMLQPERLFLFSAGACELMAEGWTPEVPGVDGD